ncbi:DinB family protein [Flavobacterium aquidurense]|uniref:DinB 2 domain containing protein n=1 Tax=Flavobacterium aquidurense TaxID=362413 RepID=A0A0Q0Y4C1_9FLAO|nr:DinB family protein [Flavobacterium aquidurense]KQB43583.1 DinB 2 domain containing protein [Flavobacterium aquidurense]
MKTKLQKNIVETFKELNEIISSFSEEELNTVPFKGSWTPGQVIQHIILGNSGYTELFGGNTKKTIRKYDEHVKELETIFLNFNTKMDAPDFLKPEIKNYNKNSLTLSLLKIESDLLDTSENCDLTLTCLDFNVPGFENFTIYEWINFALVHTQRHTNQLHKINHYITTL